MGFQLVFSVGNSLVQEIMQIMELSVKVADNTTKSIIDFIEDIDQITFLVNVVGDLQKLKIISPNITAS